MTTANTSRFLVLAMLLTMAAPGCVSAPHVPGTPLENAALAQELRRSLDAMYPPGFRAVHRALLSVRGREFTMMGYVLVRRPGDVRLLATGDMAVTMFEVVRRSDGSRSILRTVPGFRASWIREGAARDAAAIYCVRPSSAASLAQFGPDVVGFTERLRGGTYREFHFDATTRRLTRYLEARRGHRRYEIAFSDEAPFPRWPRPVPRKIDVIDRVRNYRLNIRVVELRPVSPTDASFATEP